jgi:hypothetical protein
MARKNAAKQRGPVISVPTVKIPTPESVSLSHRGANSMVSSNANAKFKAPKINSSVAVVKPGKGGV